MTNEPAQRIVATMDVYAVRLWHDGEANAFYPFVEQRRRELEARYGVPFDLDLWAVDTSPDDTVVTFISRDPVPWANIPEDERERLLAQADDFAET